MNPNHKTKTKKGKSNKNKANANLDDVKSKFILKKIIAHLPEKKFMKIIKYNKHMRHRLNLDNTDYKKSLSSRIRNKTSSISLWKIY